MPGQTFAKMQLSAYLDQFGLGFLAKNEGFASIPNIHHLVRGGDFSEAILYELQIKSIKGASQKEVANEAIAAFSKLQSLASDFIKGFFDAQKIFANGFLGQPRTLSFIVTAFKDAMNKGMMTYKMTDSPLDCMLKSHLDCDTSAQLFIQFAHLVDARGLNLQIMNAYSRNTAQLNGDHQVLMVGKTHLIETNRLLYLGKDQQSQPFAPDLPGAGKSTGAALAERADYLADAYRDAERAIVPIGYYERLPYPSDPQRGTVKGRRYICGIAGCTLADFKKLEAYAAKYHGSFNRSNFKFRNREEYAEYEAHYRNKWEQQEKAYGRGECSIDAPLKALDTYIAFLKAAEGTLPIFGVDNEAQIMRLYRKGVKLFGKAQMDRAGITDLDWAGKVMNPIDYFMSKTD